MKLLFDENLSYKLPGSIAGDFPDSRHVREVGLKGGSDKDIWDYARKHGFVIISKDNDFNQRALLYGSPPKFIWLRLGNCKRSDVLNLIQRHKKDILAFATSAESVLVLS